MSDVPTSPIAGAVRAGEIQPSLLVKSDAAPVVPASQQISPAIALFVVVGISLLIAIPLRMRIQRSRMDPRELAFVRMAQRLRLTRIERVTMRQLASVLPSAETEAKISPAALLLSERAFLRSAARWIVEKDTRERAERVVTLQRKVFAPNRK